jgi:hypothetical protein
MSGGTGRVGCISGVRGYRFRLSEVDVPLGLELITNGGIGIPRFFRALLWIRDDGTAEKGGITQKFSRLRWFPLPAEEPNQCK